jgi:sodium transport system ATP-binding protein
MIEAHGLIKRFRSLVALDGISFTAKDGEVTGLVGPNGAGKTTALRLLTTVMRPDSGSISIDGFDTGAQPIEAQKRLGVLADARGLYPRLTAREHVRYFGRLHGIPRRELDQRIDRLIERLGMADFADRRAKGFSKGQAMKVALARALVHEPRNLLLDEPTNGLDITSSRAMRGLIGELKAQGRCILFCSHIFSEVAALSDRLIILSQGKIAAMGRTEDIIAESKSRDLEEAFLALTGASPGAPP